jgi:hypothetical protein
MNAFANQDAAFSASARPSTTPNRRLWAGRIVSALVVAFLLFDAGCKLLLLPFVIEASGKLGFSATSIFAIGLVLFLSVLVHLVPRTAVLGAVLLTGYLGGAVCTHVRNGDGLFPIAFATVFGALVWLGLYLRDERLRAFVHGELHARPLTTNEPVCRVAVERAITSSGGATLR